MRSSFPLSAVFALLLLPSSWGLCAQESSPDFSSIDSNLEKLESLIADTLSTSETLTAQLEGLSLTLNEKEQLLDEQENLLKELRKELNGMSETYRTLSSLSKKYESSSRFWRTFTIIGIPAAALISGLTVGIVTGVR
jgi:septal ring factor EnvC (AmiA/AmiB activator)